MGDERVEMGDVVGGDGDVELLGCLAACGIEGRLTGFDVTADDVPGSAVPVPVQEAIARRTRPSATRSTPRQTARVAPVKGRRSSVVP